MTWWNPRPATDVQLLVEPTIEYVFGSGNGHTNTYISVADLTLGTGLPDAVRLDFDGDGLIDDALWDRDGDGRAECSGLDLDDDGRPEAWFTDDGSGVWADPTTPTTPVTPTTPITPTPDVASQTPTPDRTFDSDSDGREDIAVSRSGGRLYIDTDADERFDQVLIDSDLDGVADGVAVPGQTGFEV
jgi:hypothetical protein